MKLSIVFFQFFIFVSCYSQTKLPELILSSGFNNGFKTDFVNTIDVKIWNRNSFNFDVGCRVYNSKYQGVNTEITIGLGSVFTQQYVGKLFFPSGNSEIENLFFLPDYEFFNAKLFLNKKIKIYEKKNIEIAINLGFGIKYFIKTHDFESVNYNYSNSEYISYREIFDYKNESQNQILAQNRKIITALNFGFQINPTLFKKKYIGFEVFYSPSLNNGLFSRYTLSTPLMEFNGTNQYRFSNYGLKLLITIPKINLKP